MSAPLWERSCPCGRDSLGDLGEPFEHADGCTVWERARAEVVAGDPDDMPGACTCGDLDDDLAAGGWTCHHCHVAHKATRCDCDDTSSAEDSCPNCGEVSGFGAVLRRHGLANVCSACGFDEDTADSAGHHDWHTQDERNRTWRDCELADHVECFVMVCLVCGAEFPDCADSIQLSAKPNAPEMTS